MFGVWGSFCLKCCTVSSSGRPPFDAENLEEIRDEFERKKIVIESHFSRDVASLIEEMLEIDSEKRPSAKDILAKPFLAKLAPTFKKPLSVEQKNDLFKNFLLNTGNGQIDTFELPDDLVKMQAHNQNLPPPPPLFSSTVSTSQPAVSSPLPPVVNPPLSASIPPPPILTSQPVIATPQSLPLKPSPAVSNPHPPISSLHPPIASQDYPAPLTSARSIQFSQTSASSIPPPPSLHKNFEQISLAETQSFKKSSDPPLVTQLPRHNFLGVSYTDEKTRQPAIKPLSALESIATNQTTNVSVPKCFEAKEAPLLPPLPQKEAKLPQTTPSFGAAESSNFINTNSFSSSNTMPLSTKNVNHYNPSPSTPLTTFTTISTPSNSSHLVSPTSNSSASVAQNIQPKSFQFISSPINVQPIFVSIDSEEPAKSSRSPLSSHPPLVAQSWSNPITPSSILSSHSTTPSSIWTSAPSAHTIPPSSTWTSAHLSPSSSHQIPSSSIPNSTWTSAPLTSSPPSTAPSQTHQVPSEFKYVMKNGVFTKVLISPEEAAQLSQANFTKLK